MINGDGSGLYGIPTGGQLSYKPAWSPDGKKIAFVSRKTNDSYYKLYSIGAGGGGQLKLAESTIASLLPGWSLNDNRIAYSDGRDVWTVRDDGSGRVNLTNFGYGGSGDATS